VAAFRRILLSFVFLGIAFLAGVLTHSEHVFIVVFAAGVVASFVLRSFAKSS